MPQFFIGNRSLADVLESVLRAQPEPSDELVLIAGVVALAAVVLRTSWSYLRGVVTIAHEGGHALVALLTGRRIQGIRLHSDTSGVTFWRGRSRGPGAVASIAAGYLGPAVVGLAAAAFLWADRITALLWFILLLLAATLIAIRNLYGVVSVVFSGAVIFAVSWFTTEVVQSAFAYGLTWFLLFAAVRPVLELQRTRRRRSGPTSDADQLAGLTRTPPLLWVAVFLVITVGCLALGARWLLV